MDLILPLKRRWFEDIKAGRKPFEYRLNNAYWQKRLIGKNYERVIFTLGYPKRDDDSRRIVKPYLGYEMQTVVSEEWNNEPKDCFAIVVAANNQESGMHKIFGRCNDCKFAGYIALGDIVCSVKKMPKTHKQKARRGITGRNILSAATVKCDKYQPSGKQLTLLAKSPF